MTHKYVLGLFIMIIATIHGTQTKVELVEIQKLDPSILIEMPYATKNNFTKKEVYPVSLKCMLAKEPAHALCLVQKDLKAKGLGLKIWDAYRPKSCQINLWNICADKYPDEKERGQYVSNPYTEGGRHTRGYSIDVTLVDKNGKELHMPTGFDDFSPQAWSECAEVDEVAKQNRAILIEAMSKHGFKVIKCEWWHFDYQGWQDQPILDVLN